MRLYETEVQIDVDWSAPIVPQLREEIEKNLTATESIIRLAIVESEGSRIRVEVGVLRDKGGCPESSDLSVLEFRRRRVENAEQFNAALVVPTGIDAMLGGHAGDGGALARLVGSVCDRVITHPNVVNASDINELPDNGLYVEGSVLSRLLQGTAALQPVRANRLMVVMDDHKDTTISEHTINAVSAARASLGVECPIVHKMQESIGMYSEVSRSGRAIGRVDGLERLCKVLRDRKGEYDAVALTSTIRVPKSIHQEYYFGGIVNPWGGVEAMLTHAVSGLFNVPSAHSPMMESQEILNLNVGVVDPRMAAEVVSVAYLHCIIKGLHKSPKIVTDPSQFMQPGVLSAEDISCLVIPDGCVGVPTLAAMEQGIPVIAVRENKNLMRNDLSMLPFSHAGLFIVDNYLEAVGVMQAIKSGIALEAVRRPLGGTNVYPSLRKEVSDNIVKLRAK